MKKLILLICVFVFISNISISQNIQFNSTFTTLSTGEYKSVFENHTITVSKNQIVVTKLWNGGTEDAILTINRIENKDYSFDGPSTWYYCTDTKKDFINGNQKVIMIYPNNSRQFNMFVFADEVNVYQFVFNK